MKKKFPFKKQKSKKNYLVFSILLTLIIVSSFGVYNTFQSEKIVVGEKNENKFYPTLYSDKNITKNAVIADSRFKDVYGKDRRNFLSNVISSFKKTEIKALSGKSEKGTWLWTDTLNITPKYRNMIISEAKKNGMNSIYISIDTYLDIYTMLAGPEKDKKQKEFDNVLRGFIREANRNGIEVDAEAGWRNWAEEGHTYKTFAILEYVKDFNNKYEENFRGIQYDIEPYILENFQENKKDILKNFLNLAQRVVSEMSTDNNLELTFVIPEFYDGVDGRTPRFFYGTMSNYTFDHLAKILSKRGGSKIILMSYRNFTDGIDGVISISKDEIERANIYGVKVILAQEFGKIEPAIYTFHNTSRDYYKKHIAEIEKTFSLEKSFGGIASHYINAVIELE